MDIGPIMDYHATKNLGMGMSFSVSVTPKTAKFFLKNCVFFNFEPKFLQQNYDQSEKFFQGAMY